MNLTCCALALSVAQVFFPPQEGNSALVETFVIFGAAFLMRPIGGAMLGYIGDKYGRKKALELRFVEYFHLLLDSMSLYKLTIVIVAL